MEKLGAHGERVRYARELLEKKGRRSHGAFAVEGPTLVAEARRSGAPLHALYLTARAAELPLAREIEAAGVPAYLVDERTFAKISDVEHPSGILAVTPLRLRSPSALLREPGLVLLLADLNDPGNAGTLLRSAEAFGVHRVVFGSRGVEPHHPKVVRAAMGAIFRLELALATPEELAAALESSGFTGLGLAAGGEPLAGIAFPERTLLAVGHERHGLGPWEPLCARKAAIPMLGSAESLNAAIAGSIALYEASKRSLRVGV